MKFDRVDIVQAYMLFDRQFGHEDIGTSGIVAPEMKDRILRINPQVYAIFKKDVRAINVIAKKYMTINCKDIYKQLLIRFGVRLPDEKSWQEVLILPGGKLGYKARDEKVSKR